MPRLKLWAWRIGASEIHDHHDNPPDSPALSGVAPKRPRKDSLSEAINGAAVAISVKALSTDHKIKRRYTAKLPTWPWTGVSRRAVDLRM